MMRRTRRQEVEENKAILLSLSIIAASLIGLFALFASALAHDQGNIPASHAWTMVEVVAMVVAITIALYTAAIIRR